MRVTREWIDRFKTGRGGWTRKQLAAIGVEWPPPKGWKHRAEGTEIDEKARAIFEGQSRSAHAGHLSFGADA